jgi:outer membrane protein assembly factor BamB
MTFGQSRLRILIVVALALVGGAAFAATFYGTVEDVSPDDNSVSIKLIGKQGTTKKFTLGPKAQILVEGKKIELAAVEAGQNATVLTDTANNVTRLSLKNAKGKTGSTVTSKSARTSDATSTTANAAEGEWPQYRGPNRDNISTEKGLLETWPADGPKLAWKQTGLGDGYSSVAIANGKLFTMGNRGNDEMLLAFNVSTGEPLWATKTGRAYTDGTGNGPRGTPTIDKDRVYALGANGDLACVGEEKGEIVWKQNILDEYGGNNIQWGISESVLVDGNNLICSPGGRQGTIVALNKLTGRPVWRSNIQGAPQAAYSSPIAVDFGGVKQYVNFVHTGVVSVSAKDGAPLWGFRESANGTANCSTPLYADGTVYTSSGYGTGAAAFKLAPSGKATLAYSNKEMVNHHGGMVLLDGHVYGFDEQVLKCIDLTTGKEKWKSRSVGKGSLTYADGHLYLRGERGPVALAVATTNGYEEKGQFDPPTRSGKPSWSHPVVCGGKLFLRDMDTLLAYDVTK